MKNIFEYDAVPTWSGFLYQGRIAVYLAVRKILELLEDGKESEIEKYALEMEKCEDIAIVYVNGNDKKYYSIHQVKNEKGCKLGEYKNPLIQLMLEKGFCKKYDYGTPDAYLHVSNQIDVEDKDFDEYVSECVTRWKKDILEFYDRLNNIQSSFMGSGGDMGDLVAIMNKKSNIIGINRKEYKTKFSNLEKVCRDALVQIDKGEDIDKQEIKETLDVFLKYLSEKLYVAEVCDNVQVYEYESGKNFCSGSEVFKAIVALVKRYKGEDCGVEELKFEYIADTMIHFVEKTILDRHTKMQKNESASCEIMLSEFKSMLDGAAENYDEEGNVLALIRMYNDRMEKYCQACQRKNNVDCQNTDCKLKETEYRKGILEKNEFVKFCYNLNPECDKQIIDRTCLGILLDRNGMAESVFPIIKGVAEEHFIDREDKIHIKVKNDNKVAYVTAISSMDEYQTVEDIAKAMKENQEIIETIFDADQLITTRLEKDSKVWDSSCIKVRPDDIDDMAIRKMNNENSIYVPKRPEFVKAEEIIKSMENE